MQCIYSTSEFCRAWAGMPKREEEKGGMKGPMLEISTHKCENNLELVLCTVNNPLYALYVTVPVLSETWPLYYNH